ncbi:acyl carrier protein [Kitasatospora sp. NPDC059408]|uniref:acyl carrier protein n=1 Tax=Kitasatospora sp. NPDC059408 TaxID=3346823 RepID=UPI0036917328
MTVNGTATLSIEEFVRILRDSAGEDEAVDLSGDIADVPFTDLGYDSLALLEVTARVSRDYGVDLPDRDLDSVDTPQGFVDLVNSVLSQG